MEKKKFPWGRTFLVGFGFFGISILWPIFNQWVPLILQAGNPGFKTNIPNFVGFGIGPALAMFIMTWDNIVNIFVQPWVGNRSDHTWNRFGRRKPWILLGLPIALVGFISIPLAQSVLAVAVFIMVTNVGMALFRSPVVSWLGDLFLPEQRSKANGVINLMGGAAGVLSYVLGGLIFNAFGRMGPFVAGAVAMTVALAAVLIWVKEPKERLGKHTEDEDSSGAVKGLVPNLKAVFSNQDKSTLFILLAIFCWFTGFNAIETGLSSFAVFDLGIAPGKASIVASIANLSFLAFCIPSGILAGRLGRKKTILYGVFALTLIFLISFFLVKGLISFIIILVLVGFFWSWVNVNSLPLVYDHGDEKRIGAYTGLYYFFSQTAAVLGPTLGGLLVEKIHFNYKVLFIFGAVFLFLAFLSMLKVKDRAHEEKMKLGAGIGASSSASE
ncbi:MAG TPA: MFS transporter [Anaerolineaceae bacterium]|nr:MFS transporter [Anaerolineaceae bacterium]